MTQATTKQTNSQADTPHTAGRDFAVQEMYPAFGITEEQKKQFKEFCTAHDELLQQIISDTHAGTLKDTYTLGRVRANTRYITDAEEVAELTNCDEKPNALLWVRFIWAA